MYRKQLVQVARDSEYTLLVKLASCPLSVLMSAGGLHHLLLARTCPRVQKPQPRTPQHSQEELRKNPEKPSATNSNGQ